jgi:hypothetical protein
MKQEEIEQLKQLLARLKEETEDYVGHDKLARNAESYLLIIAMEKYIERYG